MLRWLLKSFQQRVPGRRRQHVNLVNNINFKAALAGRVGNAVANIADIFNFVV